MKEKIINIGLGILKLAIIISGTLSIYFILMDFIFSDSIYHGNIVKSILAYIFCYYLIKYMKKNKNKK